MQSLRPCAAYTNDVVVRNSVPATEIWRDVLYVPVDDGIAWERDPRWGLYDKDGALIDAGAYFRGPGKNLVGQQLVSSVMPEREIETALPGKYMYCGVLIGHYGHFILSCLSRYWLGLYEDLSQYKIICHAAGVPEGWLTHPFIKHLLGAIGIKQENLVVFKRPTLIPEVIVPRPAAEEHNFTHMIYGEWGPKVGQALHRNLNIAKNPRPAWLAKTKISAGVQGFENEAALVEILEANGVDIVHPQDLSIVEQVALFRSRPLLLGATGSAFHTKALGCSAKCICLNNSPFINSNFALIDAVSDNKIDFFIPEYSLRQGGGGRFTQGFQLADPGAVAHDLLEMIERHGT